MAQQNQHLVRILTSYYRPKPGGFCKRLFRCMRALLDAGHEVHYLSTERFPVEHPRCHYHKFPWPQHRADGLLFWAWFHLAAPVILCYLGFRHRITHAFAFNVTYGLLMQPMRYIRGVPLTVFLRGDGIASHRLNARPEWLISLESVLEGLAIRGTRLVSVSRPLLQTIISRHGWARPAEAVVLPNDIGTLFPLIERPFTSPLRFAFVGVLERGKNPAFLIDCAALLEARSFSLDFYGTGPDLDKLKEQSSELGIAALVNFKGWVSEGPPWSEIDLLLTASLHEGSPNAVLEAMAHGVPVLASDIPGHREILPKLSLLPLNDQSAWINALGRILRSPEKELRELRDSQHAIVETFCFDWDAKILECILGVSSPDQQFKSQRI